VLVNFIEIPYYNEVRLICTEQIPKKKRFSIISGGNGLDFFQADPLTAQYLQPTSPTSGLPIAVRR